MPLDYDDDARDFRAILEETQAQLSLIADVKLDVTQTLLLAGINVNLALAIAIGRQTGILAKLNDTAPNYNTSGLPTPPIQFSTWAANNKLSLSQLVALLRHMEARVPDYYDKKIAAIKEIRAYTSLGLKESKDLMDLVSADLPNPWWR